MRTVLALVSKNLPVPHHPKDSSSLWKPAATQGLIQTLRTSLKTAQGRPKGELESTENPIGRSRYGNVLPAPHLLVRAAHGFSLGPAALPCLFMYFHGPRDGHWLSQSEPTLASPAGPGARIEPADVQGRKAKGWTES